MDLPCKLLSTSVADMNEGGGGRGSTSRGVGGRYKIRAGGLTGSEKEGERVKRDESCGR